MVRVLVTQDREPMVKTVKALPDVTLERVAATGREAMTGMVHGGAVVTDKVDEVVEMDEEVEDKV